MSAKLLVVTNRESEFLYDIFLRPEVIHLDPTKTSILLTQNDCELIHDKKSVCLSDVKYAYFPGINLVPCHNLMFFLESLGIVCIPGSQSFIDSCSKFKSYIIMKRAGIPIIPTMFGSSLNINCKNVQDLLSDQNIVEKPDKGSLGAGCKLMDREAMANLEKQYIPLRQSVIFQKYVTPNTEKRYDLRLIVYDGRVLCAEKRFSSRDFRTNLSLGNRGEAYVPTKEECELAIKAVDSFGSLKVGGVDLIYDKDKIKVLEVNPFPGDMICGLTGVNFYEEIVKDLLSK